MVHIRVIYTVHTVSGSDLQIYYGTTAQIGKVRSTYYLTNVGRRIRTRHLGTSSME